MTAAGDAMRRFGSAALLACFAALLALSCASERALNVGNATWKAERALDVGDTVQKEIRVNGETIAVLMSVYEIAEYDSSGNLIHRTNRHAESWHEYDAAGRKIHSKETHPNEYLEGETSPISIELVHEYDANGRKIRTRNSLGGEIQYEYDTSGHLIHSMDTSEIGEENWYVYDNDGKKTYHKRESKDRGLFEETRYQYDDNGNLICKKGQVVFTDSQGEHPTIKAGELRLEYDAKGRLIHSKSSKGEEEWFEYDDKGNLICRRWPSGTLDWTDYTFWENGKVKTSIEYRYIPGDSLRH